MSTVSASLVICSRNRPRLLADSVRSVLEGHEVPQELVVIDQSDGPNPTLARLREERGCRIHYIRTRSVGVSLARNMGVYLSTHPIIAFADDDVLVAPDWFGALIRGLPDAGGRCVVTGRVLPTVEREPGGLELSIKAEEAPATYQGRVGSDVLFSGNMAMHRSTLDQVGGFDVRLGPGSPFPSSEDNDLGFRLLEAGYRILYEPRAVLYHRTWRRASHYLPMSWNYGRGQGAFYAKYLSLRDPYMLRRMGWGVGPRLLRLPWRALHRPRLAMGDLVYSIGVVSGAVAWALARRRERRW